MSTPTNTILLPSLPQKTFVGINLSTFSSSPNFQGISQIPPGLHFLYTGTDASLSIRHGYWLNIPQSRGPSKGTVHVLRWNTTSEHLDLLDPDSGDSQSAISRLPALIRGLVDYTALREASSKLQNKQSTSASLRASNAEEGDHEAEDEADDRIRDIVDPDSDPWTNLTSHISTRLLSRILPALPQPSSSGVITDNSSESWTLTSISSAPSDTEKIPGLNEEEVDEVLTPMQTLNLLPIDLKKTWNESDVGRTRTERARDRSWYLSHLLSTFQSQEVGDSKITRGIAAKDYLGEIQFTFLIVLCLANYSCLEQWKRLLSVLFTCRTALDEVEGFFVEAIAVLQGQLRRVEDVEGGLFEMADETGSAWLRRLLKGFKENIDEAFTGDAGEKLKKALGGLEEWLRKRYGWEDERNVLRRGMIQLEDGEMVEVQADGVDEDEETGEYAPVVVET